MTGTALSLLTALPGTPMQAEPVPQALLSCRFGPECIDVANECDTYDLWHILRYYPEEDRFALFDALERREQDMALTRRPHLLVFDHMESVEQPKQASSVNRLVVADDGHAVIQHAFYIEAEPDDWRFYSGQDTGICREVLQ